MTMTVSPKITSCLATIFNLFARSSHLPRLQIGVSRASNSITPSPPPSQNYGYSAPTGPNEPCTYGGSAQYASGSKPQQPFSGGSAYPQLPTARIPPSGGASNNRVPVDDVIDRVTSMGFSREQVRATVRRLTENGQSVDLNIVLDKLMNG